MKTLYIGIGHRKQQGKDTVAKYMANWLDGNRVDVAIMSFADPLKTMAMDCYGLNYDDVYGDEERKNKVVTHVRADEFKSARIKYGMRAENMPVTVRQVLQFLAEDIRSVQPNIFLNSVVRDNSMHPDVVIIPDVRYRNEAGKIREMDGLLVKVDRGEQDNVDDHESECQLGGYRGWSHTFHNTIGLDHLERDVVHFMENTVRPRLF